MACAPPPLPSLFQQHVTASSGTLPSRRGLLLSFCSFKLRSRLSCSSIGNVSTFRPFRRRTDWRAFHSDRVLLSRRCPPQVPSLAARSAAVHDGEASLALRSSLAVPAAARLFSLLLLLLLLSRRSIQRRVGACARTRTCAHARRGKFPAPGLLLLLVIPTPPLTSEVTSSRRSSGYRRRKKAADEPPNPPPSSPRAQGQGCLPLRSPFVGCAPRALCSSG